ncbi:MAG: hypothetical protein D6732_12670, partial [Methanobacteriota archaeon]
LPSHDMETVLIDSKRVYAVTLVFGILSLIITFPFLVMFVTIPGFGAVALALRWLKTRSKTGMKLAPIAAALDAISYFLSSGIAPGDFPTWYTAIHVITWVLLIAMFLIMKWELTIIPRPVVALNDEETRRARKALKTRDPEDIMSISKIREWNF